MAKLSRILALVLLVTASTTGPLSAMKSHCEPGMIVYSPIDGQMADCLEGGGTNCLSCTVYG